MGEFQSVSIVQEVDPARQKKIIYFSAVGVVLFLLIISLLLLVILPKRHFSLPGPDTGPNGEYIAPVVLSNHSDINVSIDGNLSISNLSVFPNSDESIRSSGNIGPNGEYVAPAVETAFYPTNSSMNQ